MSTIAVQNYGLRSKHDLRKLFKSVIVNFEPANLALSRGE